MSAGAPYRLFSWEHSYFSGKARAYLRYKAEAGALAFEDVLATPELMQKLLLPATGTSVVPQLLAPGGRFVQDSSEIVDFCEHAHPAPPVTQMFDHLHAALPAAYVQQREAALREGQDRGADHAG